MIIILEERLPHWATFWLRPVMVIIQLLMIITVATRPLYLFVGITTGSDALVATVQAGFLYFGVRLFCKDFPEKE